MNRSLLFWLVLLLTVAGCQRQARVSVPDNGLFLEGEAAFRSGDYQRAAAIYERLLEFELEPVRERAMIRLALIQSVQDISADPATDYSERLAAEYPDSALRNELDTIRAVLSELGQLRAEKQRQMDEFQRLTVELARIQDERASLEKELSGSLSTDTDPRLDATPADQTRPSESHSLSADLARMSESLTRLTENYQDTPVAAQAEWILNLLSEIQELKQSRAAQVERLDGLVSEVEALRKEVGKLREADLLRLPN